MRSLRRRHARDHIPPRACLDGLDALPGGLDADEDAAARNAHLLVHLEDRLGLLEHLVLIVEEAPVELVRDAARNDAREVGADVHHRLVDQAGDVNALAGARDAAARVRESARERSLELQRRTSIQCSVVISRPTGRTRATTLRAKSPHGKDWSSAAQSTNLYILGGKSWLNAYKTLPQEQWLLETRRARRGTLTDVERRMHLTGRGQRRVHELVVGHDGGRRDATKRAELLRNDRVCVRDRRAEMTKRAKNKQRATKARETA